MSAEVQDGRHFGISFSAETQRPPAFSCQRDRRQSDAGMICCGGKGEEVESGREPRFTHPTDPA
jgi:hypothetical protein